ncbi:hypothetical protein [Mycobacteroides chelonae]|uniref:hypothetical protein n=1 Tax=Mycobacteroides chelonae TaxID=1774 RepID=UPI0012FF8EDE|nr:hypothetical protein [Mycobacteroides chelonae]
MAVVSVWRRTGGLCKRGAPVEQRTITDEILQGATAEWTEVATRCCRACEGED